MFNIVPAPVRVPRVYLKGKGRGDAEEYESLEAFCELRDVEFVRRNVGDYLGDPIKVVTCAGRCWRQDVDSWRGGYFMYPEEFFYEGAFFILRTDMGDVITRENVFNMYSAISRNKYRWRYRHGTGHKRAWGGDRRFKTQNEVRQAWANADEGEPPIKPRRNRTHIPNSWDDVPRHNEKNWKYQSKRKKQYRIKLK